MWRRRDVNTPTEGESERFETLLFAGDTAFLVR